MGRARKVFGILLALFGIGLYLYPDVSTCLLNMHTKAYIREFEKAHASGRHEGEENGEGEGSASGTDPAEGAVPGGEDPLYRTCVEYNERIYREEQSELKDAWSCAQTPLLLDGLEDGGFGYIEIPAMDVTLPLYLGASESNMAKGAAVLGQTSLPIGGENTNCVIAGHRGYRGAPYFREIERLSAGDMVYITNPWGTLAYQVSSIDVISPYDNDAVKIQEEKDMVTLLTCHPYRSHGKYRYVVYCDRYTGTEGGEEGTETETAGWPDGTGKTGDGWIYASGGVPVESSGADIRREERLRRISAAVILLLVTITMVYPRIRDMRRKRSRTDPETKNV